MRILALSSEFHPFCGGIATYAQEMACAAHDLGIDVTVTAPDYGKDLCDLDRAFPFRIIRYRGGEHHAKDAFDKLALTRKLLRKSHYDIVHAMDWPFFLPIALSTRMAKRLYTIHGSDVIDMSRRGKRFAIRAARTFSGNCEVIANSEFTKSLFSAMFSRVNSSTIRHALLGVSSYWTENIGADLGLRRLLNLPEDKFLIVTVARLVPRKNQLGLIQALNLLRPDQRTRICHLIIGPPVDPVYARIVADAAAQSDIDIRVLGVVEKGTLRRIYKAADLFCLLGKQVPGGPVEGFGLVFLEAGGQGLPTLATNVGAVKEVVADNDGGLLLPCDDAASFVCALSQLMDTPDLLRRLGLGARQRALDLSWRRCAASTYGVSF